MRRFHCNGCGAQLYFENTSCLSCGLTTGYLPDEGQLAALDAIGDGSWRAVGGDGRLWKACANYYHEGVCNGMVLIETGKNFCEACALNRTIPDLRNPKNRILWSKMEAAKRRLVYTLKRLNLPLVPKSKDPENGLAFDFLADPHPDFAEGERVLTGHSGGVITINLAEADDAVREQMRLDLREVYRTVLGHFRHESGHYYWNRFFRSAASLYRVRAVFGDERENYKAALERYYAKGAPEDWSERFVTPYAAAHPWEDWAESWANYLHIMDTLETAAAFAVAVDTDGGTRQLIDPFRQDFGSILADWHALRLLLNSLNRSMGLGDAYPFVLSTGITAKLSFIHEYLRGSFP